MWGIELNVDAAPVVQAAITRGLLVNRTGGTIVRLLPPFIITEAEIDHGVEALDAALGEVRAGAPRTESLMREPRSTAETPQGATT